MANNAPGGFAKVILFGSLLSVSQTTLSCVKLFIRVLDLIRFILKLQEDKNINMKFKSAVIKKIFFKNLLFLTKVIDILFLNFRIMQHTLKTLICFSMINATYTISTAGYFIKII